MGPADQDLCRGEGSKSSLGEEPWGVSSDKLFEFSFEIFGLGCEMFDTASC